MKPLPRTTDFLVIGGGIIGITAALALRRRLPDATVVLIEKEDHCGAHASGRNSGVLHAGFYYSSDSLKARFSRDGCKEMTAWCEQHSLPLRKCGKLVVARDAKDLAQLDTLLRRATANGVVLEAVSESEAHELEPRVRTFQRALYSPHTASVDPRAVVRSMVEQARRADVHVGLSTSYLRRSGDRIQTSAGAISPGFVLNAAGLYADAIARDFGFSQRHRILPFKGLYLLGDEPPDALRMHVYPVPDLGMPFLGVHFTVTTSGSAKIGPTATPAFWRENYGGLKGFRPGELLEVVGREARLLLINRTFSRLAVQETLKRSRHILVRQAGQLVRGIHPGQWRRWGTPGIRAQLLSLDTGHLEMDFHLEGDERSLHVLNAISPAFTCSLPFSEYLVDRIEAQIG